MLQYTREVLDGETVKRHGESVPETDAGGSGESGGEGRIGEIGLLGEAEREQILREWTGRSESMSGAGVWWCVQEQARRRGKKVAVKYGEREWTYEELNRRSNQVGRYLRRKGVGGEKRVGVMVERSLEMVRCCWEW